jgi:hypothetical protein
VRRRGRLRIEQQPEAAASGRVVGATFRLSIRDETVGSRIVLTIGHGATVEVAVTVCNLLGDEPVPVFAHLGSSADQPGWPIELGTEWLVEPVQVESGW